MSVTTNTSTGSITVTQPTLIKVNPTDPTVLNIKATAVNNIKIEATLNKKRLL
tara:strand:+ start:859 stop:1017 length:159 start_codon:yes stop_codon:yes gene_type:complete